MRVPEVNVLDFETEAIARRPGYPPKPVGFSLKTPSDRRSRYWGWGHPAENNCSYEDGQRALAAAYRNGYPFLAHHGKFDFDVAETHMAMPRLTALSMHDTTFLLFLSDPHAKSLSLKPSAERILGMKPEERDIVKEWLFANHPPARKRPSEWGAYIARAPGKIVGRYADGDVVRTFRLFNKLYQEIARRGRMMEAYEREQRLMPVLLDAERRGVPCYLRALKRDCAMYSRLIDWEMPDGDIRPGLIDNWLRKALKRPRLNMNADREVGEALNDAGIVTEWTLTEPTRAHPNGQRSVAKKNMGLDLFRNRRVAQAYGYRQRLQTCLSTFFLPWIEMARASGRELIYTNWNQVRETGERGNFFGARTGRLSSNPNLQNIPTDFLAKDDFYEHPAFLNVPPLPLMRKYLHAGKGRRWIHRDYAQQELRILAHFENGALQKKYNDNEAYDMHTDVQAMVGRVLKYDIARGTAKILNFLDIYGGGNAAFAGKARITVKAATAIKKAKRAAMPDFARLLEEIETRGKAGLPIETWGGREYFAEERMWSEEQQRWFNFEYKLLNYLIQGSAGDCAKEALIRYNDHPAREADFLTSVHDETNAGCDNGRVKEEMGILRDVMESVEFRVFMRSSGKTGPNWGTLKLWPEGKVDTTPHESGIIAALDAEKNPVTRDKLRPGDPRYPGDRYVAAPPSPPSQPKRTNAWF